MALSRFWTAGGVLLVIAALAGSGTVGVWRGWLWPAAPEEEEHEEHQPAASHVVKLSAQARKNLGLIVRPVELVESHPRRLEVPGMVIERPGNCDRLVTAPFAGVVTHIAALPGEALRPGDELVTLQLMSEPLQQAQSELYKTTRELQIVQEERDRLGDASRSGVVPAARLLELQYQQRRLQATQQALMHELAIRGLNDLQIRRASEGNFLTELTLRAPAVSAPQGSGVAAAAHGSPGAEPAHAYELEELKVVLGERVEAGQVLCRLADHDELFIEGRAFKHEVPYFSQAASQGWAVEAEFADSAPLTLADGNGTAPPRLPTTVVTGLTIRSIGNVVDPATQTVPFYLALANQSRPYHHHGKTYRAWQFRPGQRVRLSVTVGHVGPNVIPLPREAVVWDGVEAYVFRQNGDYFERRPVHVLHEDRRHVVLAHDGSVVPGTYVAHNGAAALNRAVKVQSGQEQGHHHHDH
jgi:hypothetical protein